MTQNNEREAFENLLNQYWNIAYAEGGRGVSQGSKAQEVLSSIRGLFDDRPISQNEQQPKQIPDGWKLVPIEPTKEMVEATGALYDDIKQMVTANYKAMINAAPTNTEVGE